MTTHTFQTMRQDAQHIGRISELLATDLDVSDRDHAHLYRNHVEAIQLMHYLNMLDPDNGAHRAVYKAMRERMKQLLQHSQRILGNR